MGSNSINDNNPEESAPLSYILALIQKTDDLAIKNEGTRILVNLIKNLWSQNSKSEIGNYNND